MFFVLFRIIVGNGKVKRLVRIMNERLRTNRKILLQKKGCARVIRITLGDYECSRPLNLITNNTDSEPYN